jgi:hypothetical protein
MSGGTGIIIDQPVPRPLIAIWDGGCQNLPATTPVPVSEFIVIRGSGPLNDPVAAIRSARMHALRVAEASSGVVILARAFRSALDRASVVVDLVNRGVPVLVDAVEDLARYVGPDLLVELGSVDPEDFRSAANRDRRAVSQGRALAKDLVEYPLPVGPEFSWSLPTVSILLPTMRPRLMTQAMSYISAQTYPNLEVLVLAHGDWRSPGLDMDREMQVRVIPVSGRLPLGQVCNIGIQEAHGELITKWDDDDHYGPDHIWDLVIAKRASHADLVGKAAEFVYLERLDTTIQRSPAGRYSYSTFLAGGTLAMHRSVAIEMGGFPTFTHSVDQGLIHRVRERGGRVYRTHGYGYLLHRSGDGHTWAQRDAYFLESATRLWQGMQLIASGVREEPA